MQTFNKKPPHKNWNFYIRYRRLRPFGSVTLLEILDIQGYSHKYEAILRFVKLFKLLVVAGVTIRAELGIANLK